MSIDEKVGIEGFLSADNLLIDEQRGNPAGLRLLSGNDELMIEALNGRAYISHCKKTFQLPVDNDFKLLGLNRSGPATPKILVDVREIISDMSFIEIFSSIDPDLDKSVMTQAQIIRFCKKHPDKLRDQGLSTLFLTKMGLSYFVVNVCRCKDALFVYVHNLLTESSCKSDYLYRVASPRLVV